ncbi:MAG: uroporphyrinogen decarboxylase family protein [Victivallaceae bacterium]|nr:uroporphyrinogen decarboxylase family protein [Victivallaceae bacterium]
MNIKDHILSSPAPLAMPIAVYPGLKITGDSVRQMVTDSDAQVAAILALYERYHTFAALTAMDLSVEAEAFGAKIAMSDDEIPTVSERLVTEPEEIDGLVVPEFGSGPARCRVALEVIAKLKSRTDRPRFLVGGIIGPYSLAARLYGVSEALELTLLDPDAAHRLLRKCTGFLIDYARAYRAAGADALCMAEPAAGLLWPEGLAEFASRYISEIREAVEDADFKIILHNCGCRIEHLPYLLESGVKLFHFGAPMNLVEALNQVPDDVVVSGNLDPAPTFVNASPEEVSALTWTLRRQTAGYRNFLLSSGCDIPPNAKLENLDAFFAASGH